MFVNLHLNGKDFLVDTVSEEEGEADSFVGQTTTQQTPYSYFQSPPAAGSLSDPFANIGQPDHRATPPRHTPTPPQTTFTPQSNYNQAAPVSQTSPPGVQMLPPGGQPLTPLSTAPPNRGKDSRCTCFHRISS